MRLLTGLGIRLVRTEPVVLTVTDLRNEIYAAKQGVWQTGSSSHLLSRIFHESIAGLFEASPQQWHAALSAADMGDPTIVARHLYEFFVAPRLTRFQGALQESAGEVLEFWTAVTNWSEWFCEIVVAGLGTKQLGYDEAVGKWTNADSLIEPERRFTCTLTDPSWLGPVAIEGRAGGVLRKPTGEWCVLEYKLGTGAPEADLAQAVMYQLMLGLESNAGAVALVQFQPQLKEVIYSADELKMGIERLKPLIGRLAGVLRGGGLVAAAASDGCEIPAGAELLAPSITGSQHGHARELSKLTAGSGDSFDPIGSRIMDVCKEFGAEVTLLGQPSTGSAFVRYVVSPARGVAARKISALALDLQVRLGLGASPLIRVDNGRLSIDVARKDRQAVLFAGVRSQLPRSAASSRVPLGVDLQGSLKFADLANPVNAHMLVAGSIGSGKTEWLRMAAAGLMLQNTPESLRFALIDPKGEAFSGFDGSPSLWNRERSAVDMLDALIEEMEIRYRAMEQLGTDDLTRLAAKNGSWPRIICICDEYADLVAERAQRHEVEGRIALLGANGRVANIHLIISTRRPSRDIVEGTLRANLPCKIALRVQSYIESRLVLGVSGAENLLGDGDLMFQDIAAPVRLQAPLLSEAERTELFGAQPAFTASS